MRTKRKGTTVSKLLMVFPDNSLNSVKNAFPNSGKVPYEMNAVNPSLPYTLSAIPF